MSRMASGTPEKSAEEAGTAMKMKLYSLEPVFKAGTVQAVVALVIALGFNLSAGATGVIEGGAAALLGLLTAIVVNNATPALFTGVLTAAATLLVAFGVPHVSSGLVSAVYALLAIVMASLLREKVSPEPVHKPEVKLYTRAAGPLEPGLATPAGLG